MLNEQSEAPGHGLNQARAKLVKDFLAFRTVILFGNSHKNAGFTGSGVIVHDWEDTQNSTASGGDVTIAGAVIATAKHNLYKWFEADSLQDATPSDLVDGFMKKVSVGYGIPPDTQAIDKDGKHLTDHWTKIKHIAFPEAAGSEKDPAETWDYDLMVLYCGDDEGGFSGKLFTDASKFVKIAQFSSGEILAPRSLTSTGSESSEGSGSGAGSGSSSGTAEVRADVKRFKSMLTRDDGLSWLVQGGFGGSATATGHRGIARFRRMGFERPAQSTSSGGEPLVIAEKATMPRDGTTALDLEYVGMVGTAVGDMAEPGDSGGPVFVVHLASRSSDPEITLLGVHSGEEVLPAGRAATSTTSARGKKAKKPPKKSKKPRSGGSSSTSEEPVATNNNGFTYLPFYQVMAHLDSLGHGDDGATTTTTSQGKKKK